MSDVIGICEVLFAQFEKDFGEEWQELKRLRSLRATGLDSEKARLRLDNIRRKTTTPERIIQGLEGTVLRYAKELEEHLHRAVEAAVKLEFANREIAATKELMAVRADERTKTWATEMYSEPRRVVDALFKNHGVAMGHFSTLEPSDVAAIARIIQDRFEHATASKDGPDPEP